MSRYAANTEVSSDRSRAEIETTLRRYGASAFSYGWDARAAAIMFEIGQRRMRFRLPLPDPKERRFTHTETRGIERNQAAREAEYDRAVRQSWRALALIIKAKLEAVASGIVTFEEEFLAHVVLPNGATVGEWVRPQLASAYERNELPALLPGANGGGVA